MAAGAEFDGKRVCFFKFQNEMLKTLCVFHENAEPEHVKVAFFIGKTGCFLNKVSKTCRFRTFSARLLSLQGVFSR